jgi:hypothetical protein
VTERCFQYGDGRVCIVGILEFLFPVTPELLPQNDFRIGKGPGQMRRLERFMHPGE